MLVLSTSKCAAASPTSVLELLPIRTSLQVVGEARLKGLRRKIWITEVSTSTSKKELLNNYLRIASTLSGDYGKKDRYIQNTLLQMIPQFTAIDKAGKHSTLFSDFLKKIKAAQENNEIN